MTIKTLVRKRRTSEVLGSLPKLTTKNLYIDNVSKTVTNTLPYLMSREFVVKRHLSVVFRYYFLHEGREVEIKTLE